MYSLVNWVTLFSCLWHHFLWLKFKMFIYLRIRRKSLTGSNFNDRQICLCVSMYKYMCIKTVMIFIYYYPAPSSHTHALCKAL